MEINWEKYYTSVSGSGNYSNTYWFPQHFDYCKHCGRETLNEWKFCPYCGTSLWSKMPFITSATSADYVPYMFGVPV